MNRRKAIALLGGAAVGLASDQSRASYGHACASMPKGRLLLIFCTV
jgi:hypothetical protein